MENIAEYSEHNLDLLSYDKDSEKDFDFNVYYGGYEDYLGILKLFFDLSFKYREYDAIYFDKPSNVWTSIFARLQGKKIFSHVHGREVERKISRVRSYLREGLFDFGLRIAHRFIVVSSFTANKLVSRGAAEKKVEVVHNGVAFERFSSGREMETSESVFDKNCFSLLTVSRLDERKGHDIVMEAIKDLNNVEYIIVGTGDYEESLKEKCRALGIEDKVKFVGYLEEERLPDYYASSDLFLMPSKNIEETGNFEGFGLVFLEANAAGKAVIGSNTGGIPDAIKDGETGFLAETEPEDIRDKIMKLKEDDELRCEMEENAVEWAREHDWPKVIKKIDDILED